MKRLLILSLLVMLAGAAFAQDTPIYAGDSVLGSLGGNDEVLANGAYVDWYSFYASNDVALDILLTSIEFDTFLIVEFPNGDYLSDDDGAGGWTTNSLLTMNASRGDLYRIGVTGFSSGATGAYTLSLNHAQTFSLRVGEEVSGNLTGSSVVYNLTGAPNEMIEIELTSSYFDTYLSLEDSEGTSLVNDDAGSTSVSRLMHVMASDGMAIVTVSAFRGSGSGPFNLTVQPVDMEASQYAPGYRLSDGERVQSVLIPTRDEFHGSYYQLFTFVARAGDRVEINERSDEFDCYLGVTDPAGYKWTDDDGGDGYDSRLVIIIQNSGIHEVYASALGSTSTGAFELEFAHLGTANILASGSGEITRDDPSDVMGRYYDTYTFSSRRGGQVTIDVMSDDFDGYAVLRDPSGTVVARDDDGGDWSNPRIEFYAEAGVVYELVVTTYSYETYGRYSFTVVE